MKKQLGHMIGFIVIGVCILCIIQYVLQKKWTESNTYDIVNGIYYLDDNSVDAVFLGTSHMECAVSPIEIYGTNHITTYNLATPGQPIEISYYLFKEFIKKQSPKVVVLDVSNLFHEDVDESYWRIALDQMRFGKNKIECAKDYAQNSKIMSKTDIRDALIPIYAYHTRWKNLSLDDFDFFPKKSFMYGYCMYSSSGKTNMTVEKMNDTAESLEKLDSSTLEVYQYMNGTPTMWCTEGLEMQYSYNVSNENLEYLLKLKQLCDEQKCKLILTKIPSVNNPGNYSGSWTKTKSNAVREICDKYEMDFVDILYDNCVKLDWSDDSYDGGAHLNYRGATKVSRFWAQYLSGENNIEARNEEKFNDKLDVYAKCIEVSEIQNQSRLLYYLKHLESKENVIILMSAQYGYLSELSNREVIELKKMGVKVDDFRDSNVCSYIGVIKNGVSEYEAYSKRDLLFQYNYNDNIFVVSCDGADDKNYQSITLNGETVSIPTYGFNIVVFDMDTNLVVDSVSFSKNNKIASRNGKNEKYLEEYIKYLR